MNREFAHPDRGVLSLCYCCWHTLQSVFIVQLLSVDSAVI